MIELDRIDENNKNSVKLRLEYNRVPYTFCEKRDWPIFFCAGNVIGIRDFEFLRPQARNPVFVCTCMIREWKQICEVIRGLINFCVISVYFDSVCFNSFGRDLIFCGLKWQFFMFTCVDRL